MQKNVSRLMMCVLSLVLSASLVRADQTIAYPTVEQMAFQIQAPDDWAFEAGDNEGDYFSVASPSGATLYFRTLAAEEDGLMEAIDETKEYIDANYSDVTYDEVTKDTLNGLDGFSGSGTGKDADGNDCVFVFGWYVLDSEQLVEVWFEAGVDDDDGRQAAGNVLRSLKTK